MCKLNAIENYTEPSVWKNPIKIVEKPNKSTRACLDPEEINKNVIGETYTISLLEQI